jgi:hypothetical protein
VSSAPSGDASSPTPKNSGGPVGLGTALQTALANEHAAVYGYGVLAVRLAGPQREAARNAYDMHRARRDTLITLIEAGNDRPVAAAPAYAVPFPIVTAAEATRLAAQLEERLGDGYADLVQAATGDTRRTGLEWLTDSAVRAVRWRGTSVAFPGLPERD